MRKTVSPTVAVLVIAVVVVLAVVAFVKMVRQPTVDTAALAAIRQKHLDSMREKPKSGSGRKMLPHRPGRGGAGRCNAGGVGRDPSGR